MIFDEEKKRRKIKYDAIIAEEEEKTRVLQLQLDEEVKRIVIDERIRKIKYDAIIAEEE